MNIITLSDSISISLSRRVIDIRKLRSYFKIACTDYGFIIILNSFLVIIIATRGRCGLFLYLQQKLQVYYGGNMTVKEFINGLKFGEEGFLNDDTELYIRQFDFEEGENIYIPVNGIFISTEKNILVVACSYDEVGK